MAQAIEPTPTLRGEKAINFLHEMLEEQNNPNPERLKLLEEAAQIKFNVKKD